jgi:ABC-type transporter Mla subunit MlaD
MSKEGLIEMRGLISDASFASERKELARSIKATIEGTTRLTQSLQELAREASANAQSTQQASVSSKELGETLDAVNAQLGGLAGQGGPLSTVVANIDAAGASLGEGIESLSDSVRGLREISKGVGDSVSSQQKLARLVKKVEDQLDALSGVAHRFGAVLERVQVSAEGGGKMVAELDRAAAVFPALSERAGDLAEALRKVADASDGAGVAVAQAPSYWERARGQIEAAMLAIERLTEGLRDAVRNADALGAGTAPTVAAVEAAHRLLATAQGLEATLGTINRTLAVLPSAIQSVGQNLAESGAQIRSSVSSSARVLEDDVRRSAEAASMLTNKLVEVAQTVIDRTRAQQGLAL